MKKLAAISICNVNHTYIVKGESGVVGVEDISIPDIRSGELVCIMGPNGSGKTTLIRKLAGALPSKVGDGMMEVDGTEGVVLERVGGVRRVYVPQDSDEGLVPQVSVLENLLLRRVAGLGGGVGLAVTREGREEVASLLRRMGFGHLVGRLSDPPESLSGGLRQIVSLLCGLAAAPDLLLLDEPSAQLDEVNRVLVWQLILRAAKDEGIRVVVATHDADMAARAADRICTLEGGRRQKLYRPRRGHPVPFVGEIRMVERCAELPEGMRACPNDWSSPGAGKLFGDLYFQGDDSVGGYLAGRPLSREERTRREVEGVWGILGLGGNEKIVDVPCGWGRHSVELASRGCKVVGIDASQEYLDMLVTEARRRGVVVRPLCGDMRAMPIASGEYDVVINMWTSFGFFDDADNRGVLAEFARVLKKGGMVLIHGDLNPYRVRHGIFDEPKRRTLRGQGELAVEEWYCKEDRRVYGEWRVERGGRIRGQAYRIAVYDAEELDEMGGGVGLVVESTWGGLDLPAMESSQRAQEYVVVLRKL